MDAWASPVKAAAKNPPLITRLGLTPKKAGRQITNDFNNLGNRINNDFNNAGNQITRDFNNAGNQIKQGVNKLKFW